MPEEIKSSYILLVDDTEANLRVLGPLLRAEGWSVAAVTRASEALALIARRPPDLVLLDVMMPEMDGFEVCRRLRADPATKDLPVLFITALTDEESIVRGFREGGQDYIVKPFRHTELVARVRTHLALRETRLRIEQQAAELVRLNADKDRFFSIIAHDLRSPLSGLMGLSDALATNSCDFSKEEIADAAAEMAKSARNLHQLLENLLEWALLQTGRMEFHPAEVDLSVLLRELAELFASTSQQKHITLKLDLQPTQAWVDRSMTQAVFRNLLSNALKFTANGGIITLRCRATNGKATVSVSDTGLGMTPSHFKEVLGTLQKPQSRPGLRGERGTGLGLVLCREMLQRNSGILAGDATPGRGTTFIVTLPSKQ